MHIKPILAAVLLCILLTWAPTSSTGSSGIQHVTFIDVGQGDSFHLSDGQGFDALIDGGKTSASGTVLDYLRTNNIFQLDAVLVTHADADHVGGLIAVLLASDITVSQVYYNGYPGDTDTWNNFSAAVTADGLSLTPLQFPNDLVWGAMSVHVLNPESGLSNPETNAVSVVLRIDYGETSYLLTGDIDTVVENNILARATPVAAEIIKVAHHGSSYGSSAAFLSAASPVEAVISVGPNSYGHPAEDAMQRLTTAGAYIWRTDQSGNVRVESEGDCYTVYAVKTGASRTNCAPILNSLTVYLPMLIKSDLPLPPVTPETPAPGSPTPATPTPIPPTPIPPTPVSPTPGTPTPIETGVVEIDLIFYDGTVSSAEPDEFVQIKNSDSHAIQLLGWSLSDAQNHVFSFPAFVMQPNQTCRIYTNQDHPDWCGFNYSSNSAIWNNSGDTAVLKNADGAIVDTHSYP